MACSWSDKITGAFDQARVKSVIIIIREDGLGKFAFRSDQLKLSCNKVSLRLNCSCRCRFQACALGPSSWSYTIIASSLWNNRSGSQICSGPGQQSHQNRLSSWAREIC